jgi:hypothetical protein
MLKFAATLSLAITAITAVPAMAQHNRHYDRGYRSHVQRHYVPPRQHYHRHQPRHNNWVPYAIGGLALGALGAGTYYYNNRPVCWEQVIGYDRRGREVIEKYCQ